METTPLPEKKSRKIDIFGRLAWMLVAFIGGIFVGMHQDWIPNMPWAWQPDFDKTPATMPDVSATQPAEDNSAGNPQTQLSPTSH